MSFNEIIDSRIVPKPYKRSRQTRYGAVSEQSGTGGTMEGVFQVEVTFPGTTKHLRLGCVHDTRLGAFLWCANFVDRDLGDGYSISSFLKRLIDDDGFAETWLSEVRGSISSIPRRYQRTSKNF